MDITLTIASGNVSRVTTAFAHILTKEDGYTDEQWAKECVRRYIKRVVRDYEMMMAQKSVNVPADLVT